MRKTVVLIVVMVTSVALWAETVPTLLILTTGSEQVQVPIASIQKITYDKVGQATMYVHTSVGTQTYATADIQQMTLTGVPEATALKQLTDSPTDQLTKIVRDGVVYVVKDGQLFTMKGEVVQ